MNIAGFDEIDNQILTLLQQNARQSYTELAAHVGLSRIAVKNRVTALEELGVIQGYKAIIDPKAVEGSIEFVITLCPRSETYDYAIKVLGRSKYITKLYATTGEYKILAHGIVHSSKELDAYYQNVRKIFTDVRYLSFDIIASTYKDVDGGIEYGEENSTQNGGGTD